jgi:hypothetical protein
MHGTLPNRIREAREIERTLAQGNARLCRSAFGIVCKALWPFKTAEELAALVGCAVRTASYEISGEREPSAKSLAVVFQIVATKRSWPE